MARCDRGPSAPVPILRAHLISKQTFSKTWYKKWLAYIARNHAAEKKALSFFKFFFPFIILKNRFFHKVGGSAKKGQIFVSFDFSKVLYEKKKKNKEDHEFWTKKYFVSINFFLFLFFVFFEDFSRKKSRRFFCY